MEFGRRTYIMGILNITPDSFSGDGTLNVDQTVQKAKGLVLAGADVLDLGAESSRPGAQAISEQEELERLLPALKAIRKELPNSIISVDTYRSETAFQALQNGANWINSIWSFDKDLALLDVVKEFSCPIILMHNNSDNAESEKSKLGTYYKKSTHQDVIKEICEYFSQITESAVQTGLKKENIIIDPGIGFGKTVDENLAIISNLDQFKSLGFPLLAGPSRKSFIGHVLDLEPQDRLTGTITACTLCIKNGADILRVHDVKEIKQVQTLSDKILK